MKINEKQGVKFDRGCMQEKLRIYQYFFTCTVEPAKRPIRRGMYGLPVDVGWMWDGLPVDVDGLPVDVKRFDIPCKKGPGWALWADRTGPDRTGPE